MIDKELVEAARNQMSAYDHWGDRRAIDPEVFRKLLSAIEKPSRVETRALSKEVRIHHEEQFGRLDWCRLAAKLAEETGELSGAIIRDTERRDGRPWKNEIYAELQDVLTVLHVMAARMGEELNKTANEAGEYFLTREFNNVERAN